MGLLDLLQPKKNTDAQQEPSGASSVADALLTLEDVIAPSGIEIASRSINISGTYARTFFAVSYPRYLNDGWLEPILNLEKELDVSIVIHPIDTAETLKKFQKKVAEVQTHSLKQHTEISRICVTNFSRQKRSSSM
jgi:hypothetical protein